MGKRVFFTAIYLFITFLVIYFLGLNIFPLESLFLLIFWPFFVGELNPFSVLFFIADLWVVLGLYILFKLLFPEHPVFIDNLKHFLFTPTKMLMVIAAVLFVYFFSFAGYRFIWGTYDEVHAWKGPGIPGPFASTCTYTGIWNPLLDLKVVIYKVCSNI